MSWSGADATGATAARRIEERLSSVLVRVKRKRADVGEAPGVLLVPHKVPRASARETLAGALARLGVSGEGAAAKPRQDEQAAPRRALLVCELVRDEGEEEAAAEDAEAAESSLAPGGGCGSGGGKRGREGAGEDARDQTLKRRRVVELEVSAQGTYSQRTTGPARHDEQADFAIWHAVQTGQTQPLRMLVETGMLADVNYARRADGVTALMAACSYLDLELISELLERGADVSLEDHAGFDARARIGFSLDDPDRDRLLAAVQLLDGADYVYDHYRVKQRVEVSGCAGAGAGTDSGTAATTAAVSSDVWTLKGALTAWQDAPLADFELDLDLLSNELVLDAVDDDDEVRDSDRENENDENYMYNDYPDETSNDAEESSNDSDAYAEDKLSEDEGEDEEGAVARAARRAARPRGLRRVQMATARDDDEDDEVDGMDVYNNERVPGGDEFGGAFAAALAERAKAAETEDSDEEEEEEDEGEEEDTD
jgi:hypothetical protein